VRDQAVQEEVGGRKPRGRCRGPVTLLGLPAPGVGRSVPLFMVSSWIKSRMRSTGRRILEVPTSLIVRAAATIGVELRLERFADLQKQMALRPRILWWSPCTQMLESMIQTRCRPRADFRRRFDAVYEGADAIMLSAEIRGRKFPVEAVSTMNRIAKRSSAKSDHSRHREDLTAQRAAA